MAAEIWDLQQDVASLQRGDWGLRLRPASPQLGIEVLTRSAVFCSLMRCEALPGHSYQVEEVYVRQKDLIARFAQTPQDAFAFQLNYHALEPSSKDLLGLEIWVSIQTDDLDSAPMLRISSQSPGTSWQHFNHGEILGDNSVDQASSGPAALVFHHPQFTAAWLIEFSDQRNTRLCSSASEPEQSIELFGHFMEKGVIRRARMRLYLLPPQAEHETLKSLYRDFTSSPLPLTA